MKERTGKICWNLYLTVDEERILISLLKAGISSIAYTIIKKAYNRDDFIKRRK